MIRARDRLNEEFLFEMKAMPPDEIPDNLGHPIRECFICDSTGNIHFKYWPEDQTRLN